MYVHHHHRAARRRRCRHSETCLKNNHSRARACVLHLCIIIRSTPSKKKTHCCPLPPTLLYIYDYIELKYVYVCLLLLAPIL